MFTMRIHLSRFLVAGLAGILLLAATLAPGFAQQGHSPFPAATPVEAAGGWQVVDQQELSFDGEPVSLSPDGQWIAGIGPERAFCVWEVASLDATCDDQQLPIQPDSIRWSPDSTAVAYSIEALKFLYDSDVFVFELATGETTNLTNDDFADTLPLSSDDTDVEDIPVDIMPAWAPDSQSLVFSRSVWTVGDESDDAIPTELMTIDRAGGEPEQVAIVRDDYPWAVFLPIFVLEDGSLLYTVMVNDFSDPGNGLWLMDADGETTLMLPGADSDDYPAPAVADVRETADGLLISGYSAYKVNQFDVSGETAFLLDTVSGAVTPATNAPDASHAASPVRFSPDGTATIGIEWPGDEPHLVIRDETGITDLGMFDPSRFAYSRGIDWAANDTILVVNLGGSATLLAVAAE